MERRHSGAVRRLLSAVVACALVLAFCPVAGFVQPARAEQGQSSQVEQVVAGMTLDEKVSQMVMPAIRTWDGNEVTSLEDAPALAQALRKHQYGGIILFGANVVGTEQTARLVNALQENNAQAAASAHVPYFIAADQEGGTVARLNMGTRGTGSMAIGATGAHAVDNARITGDVFGEELAALGVNVDFGPCVDVISDPADQGMSVRVFSGGTATAGELACAFGSGLADHGVIATYKHFPGAGDGSDDPTAVRIPLAQLEAEGLTSYRKAVDAGADMIMVSAVTFPEIDDVQVLGDGTKGYYPATMSERIVGGMLRGQLGYDGVVVTDALDMEQFVKEPETGAPLVEGEKRSLEYAVNVAEKAISAGCDILLMPTSDISDGEQAAFYDGYIEGISAKVQGGDIPESSIDASVTRILKAKEKHGALVYDNAQPGIDERVAAAKQTVGSQEHHAKELGIARQAVTLVKNDAGALPVAGAGTKTVILARLKADAVGVAYALEQLKAACYLDEDAYVDNLAAGTVSGSESSATRVTIDYYGNDLHFTDELKDAIAQADTVACLSAAWGLYSLQPTSMYHQGISTALDLAHAANAKFVLVSCNLPYDAARYQGADAILLAYLGSGMGVDPAGYEEGTTSSGAYCANAIAAIEALFGRIAPQGTLPVDVPALEEGDGGAVAFSKGCALYSRGFGLTFDALDPLPEPAPAKKANGLSVKTKTVKAKATTLAKKKVTVAAKKAFTVTGASGKVTYKVSKQDKTAKGKVAVNSNGTVVLKKGLKKGTYKLKVKVSAAGDKTHLAGSCTVTLKVKVQ